MNKANQILSIVFFCLGLIIIIIAPSQVPNLGTVDPGELSAVSFPRFCGGLMMFASVCLLVQSVIERKKEGEGKPVDYTGELRVLVVYLMMVGFAFLAEVLGFVITAFLFGTVYFWYLKVRKWQYYVIYYAIAIIAYLVFTKLLYVYLPNMF